MSLPFLFITSVKIPSAAEVPCLSASAAREVEVFGGLSSVVHPHFSLKRLLLLGSRFVLTEWVQGNHL